MPRRFISEYVSVQCYISHMFENSRKLDFGKLGIQGLCRAKLQYLKVKQTSCFPQKCIEDIKLSYTGRIQELANNMGRKQSQKNCENFFFSEISKSGLCKINKWGTFYPKMHICVFKCSLIVSLARGTQRSSVT